MRSKLADSVTASRAIQIKVVLKKYIISQNHRFVA